MAASVALVAGLLVVYYTMAFSKCTPAACDRFLGQSFGDQRRIDKYFTCELD